MYSPLLLPELHVFPKVPYNISGWLERKKTKTFLTKGLRLYFRSHLTDSWQVFLKITSVLTVVSQTIFPRFSASEWNPWLPGRLQQSFFPVISVSAPWFELSPLISLSVLRLVVLREMVLKDRYISRILLGLAFIFCLTQLQRESSKPCFDK